ncbi:LCP family protein [Streptomyces phytohabitans]|uniref:LCP family protein n=1 Tax=Streptomyces phytohabitans TaxID=1150371 RepID=UPI00345BA143
MATSAVVLATSGVGNALVSGLDDGVRRVDPFSGMTDRPNAAGGLNFLVVGVDQRDQLSKATRQKYRLGGGSCDCTDTLMLVHLSEDRQRMSVVSIPRDSYVKLPDHRDDGTGKRHTAFPTKINSAYAHGGPHLTVRAVEAMTKVHIDHYLEVDFGSFMKTVDTLGGVDVCTVRPLKDTYAGLDLPAGTSRLNGAQALSYVRARHLDGASDFGRMQRQQRFLASVIDKATSSGVLMNPVKFNEVAKSLLKSVRADRGFGTAEMVALGEAMREFTPASSEFVSVPVANGDYRVPALGSTVKWDTARAERLFDALRDDRPLAEHKKKEKKDRGGKDAATRAVPVDIPPGSIRVQVENGTAHAGLGHKADTALREVGFSTTGIPRNAREKDLERTVITYDPRWNRSVRTLAAALPGAELEQEKGRGPSMKVTVGTDFRAARAVRVAEPLPTAGTDKSGKGFQAVTGDEVTCG